MSGLRRHCVIVLEGTKYDIVTSARDVANAEKTGIDAQSSPMLYTLAVVHAAALRLDLKGVPHDFDTFIDTLDDFEDLEGDAIKPDPTHAGR